MGPEGTRKPAQVDTAARRDYDAAMGKFDRRNSMKMRRRKAQAKKKGRAAKKVEARKSRVGTTPAKRSSKKSAASAT
jgi:hypothetical protein